MFSKLLLAFSLIATLSHLSSCAIVGGFFVSKKQTVTFQLPNEKSKLYLNDSFYGQGASLKFKVPKNHHTEVRIETEGHKTMYNVLPLYKKTAIAYFPFLNIVPMAGVSQIYQNPPLTVTQTVLFTVGWSSGLIFLDYVFMGNTKHKKYPSEIQYTDIYPQIKRQDEQKEIVLKSFSFAVAKEKNTIKEITEKEYFKNPQQTEQNEKASLSPEGEIKGESVVLYNLINEKLAASGFIDTTSERLLKSKTNILYLENEVTEIEKILVGNIFCYKFTSQWIIRDSYNNLKKELTTKSKSGFFYISVSDTSGKATSKAIADATETSLFHLFENQGFQSLLKAETPKENLNTVVQNINRPAQKPQSFEDAMQACATILVENSKEKSHGSGFFISTDGYLITNYHVIAGMDKITVKTNDDKTHSAKVLRFDFENDLALLKIEATSPFAFEIPNDKNYKIGIDVFTIGTPSYENLSQTLSKGILSSIRKSEVGNEVLQTDVSVNFGNSGGPLFNKEFQLIGVVNSKLMGRGVEGIAFGSAAKDLLKQLNLAY